MNQHPEFDALRYREGTSQQDRQQPALDPATFALDERSIRDLLQWARRYGKQLKYFDEDLTVRGDWSDFVPADLDAIMELLADPTVFDDRPEVKHRLTQPHFSLFLTFLRLLDGARRHMNTFTHRHLEFYYREALRMRHKPGIPDRVYVLASAANQVAATLVPEDTRLLAGSDSQGNPLHYATVDDVVINRTQVARVASLFVEKRTIGLPETRDRFKVDDHATLRHEMLRCALGETLFKGLPDPPAAGETEEPGNPAVESDPQDPAIDPEPELPLTKDWLAQQDLLLEFILHRLGLHFSALRRIMRIYTKRIANEIGHPVEESPETWDVEGKVEGYEWMAINEVLEGSIRDRLDLTPEAPTAIAGNAFNDDGTEYAYTFRDQPRNFLANVAVAIELNPMDPKVFEEVPGADNIYELYQQYILLRADEEAYAEHYLSASVEHLHEKWGYFMEAEDFKKMMGIRFEGLNEWQKITDLLEIAAHRVLGPLPLEAGIPLEDYVPDPLHYYLKQGAGVELPQDSPGAFTFENIQDVYRALLDLEAYLGMDAEDYYWISRVKAEAPDWQWERVYTTLTEVYRSKFPDAAVPRPEVMEWTNLYAAADATEVVVEPDLIDAPKYPHWRTFGQGYRPEGNMLPYGRIGFAVASPLLNLREGERKISVTLYCWDTGYQTLVDYLERRKNIEREKVEIYEELPIPLTARISTAKGWLPLSVAQPEEVSAPQPKSKPEPKWEWGIPDEDPQQYKKIDARGKLVLDENKDPIIEEHPLPGIRFTFVISRDEDPIAPLDDSAAISSWPVLELSLADVIMDEEQPDHRTKLVEIFRDLVVAKIDLEASVTGLTDFYLENDRGPLNAQKPFMPFGPEAPAHSRFYLTHPELAAQRLDSLTLHFDWKAIPTADYYQAYRDIGGDKELGGAKIPVPIEDETSFTVKTTMRYRRSEVSDYIEHPLFGTLPAVEAETVEEAPPEYGLQFDGENDILQSHYNRYDTEAAVFPEVLESTRYLQVELNAPDFQSAIYPHILTRQAQLTIAAQRKEPPEMSEHQLAVVNPPFVPELRSIKLDYSARETLFLRAGADREPNAAYHLHPFGYSEVADAPTLSEWGVPIFPHYNAEGHLYVGLVDLHPPQVVSILFQMVEGSGDPNYTRPAVQWQYLTGHRWQPLTAAGRVLLDETKGLLTSGRIKFDIPADASPEHTLMPDGFFWLRAIAYENSAALSDTVGLHAQALAARFVDQDNAPDHLRQPLPAGSIRESVTPLPAIARLEQPYSSLLGKPAEADGHFYTRVAERLRHKQRALSAWDYERLILERFPDIYKVKCLPSDLQGGPTLPGRIDLIVIPDTRGLTPSNPFAPKVPADRLLDIAAFLEDHASPWADIRVRNPVYYLLTVRLGVRFRERDTDFYQNQLELALKKYLSPWAVEAGADIALSREIYPSRVVRFLDELDYVDYVSHFEFVVQKPRPNGKWETVSFSDQEVIRVDRPDVILVSAPHHRITVFEHDHYDEDNIFLTGINFMEIELDFHVAP